MTNKMPRPNNQNVRKVQRAIEQATDPVPNVGSEEMFNTVSVVPSSPEPPVVAEEDLGRYIWTPSVKALYGRKKPSQNAAPVRILHSENIAVVKYHNSEWAEVKTEDSDDTFFVMRKFLKKAK